MDDEFLEPIYEEIAPVSSSRSNVIKATQVQIVGKSKLTVEENSEDDVTIFLKKDASDNIQEIKFVCACGRTKSILLDYS